MRLAREPDGLVHASHASSRVDVHRHLTLTGQGEQREQLLAARGRSVGEPGPDGDGATIEPERDPLHDVLDFRGGCRLVRAGSGRQERTRVAQHGHAHLNVAHADAVVDELSAVTLAIPGVDVAGSDLQLQRGRDAVARPKRVNIGRFTVGVQIDESRDDDGAGGVNGRPAGQSVGRNGADGLTVDADPSGGIEIRLGIQHPAVGDHQIESLAAQQREGQQRHHCGGTDTARTTVGMLIDHVTRRIIPVRSGRAGDCGSLNCCRPASNVISPCPPQTASPVTRGARRCLVSMPPPQEVLAPHRST